MELEPKHNDAIRKEIAEQLRILLSVEEPQRSSELSVLVRRLKQIELLLEVNFRIARAELAVMGQISQFEKLREYGSGTATAERTLRAFAESLKALKERRELRERNSGLR